MKKFYSFVSTMCIVLLMATTSHGGVIVGAQGISSTGGDIGGDFALSGAIDQTGLSAGYTSGVTDFSSVISSVTHDTSITSNSGFTLGMGAAVFTFDLGSAITVDALAFWQAPAGSGAVLGGGLFADDDADFSNGNTGSLGGFFASANSDPIRAFTPDVVLFAGGAVTTQFIHLDVSASELSDANNFAGIGEIAFRGAEVAVVPEPSSALLLSLAGGLFALRRRR